MAFHGTLTSTELFLLNKGNSMKNCLYCSISFHVRNRQECCSVKCKLLANIEKDEKGCWIYGSGLSGIYGKLRWNMKWIASHRASYEQFVGTITPGSIVCHKCDVPKCVNPDHLFLGTQADNIRDSFIKKRKPIGERNFFAKFTDDQIKEMRLLKKEGFTYLRLRRIFNCGITHIWSVLKNKSRKE